MVVPTTLPPRAVPAGAPGNGRAAGTDHAADPVVEAGSENAPGTAAEADAVALVGPVAGQRLERWGLAVGIAIVVATAVARIDSTSLWLDEAYSLGAANHLGASLRGTSGTMGLYYVLLSAWSQISTATWWLRLPSVLFAVATLVALRPLARRIGGPALAAVALPLTALGPLFAWKAIEARSYSLATLIAVLCWTVAVRAMDAADVRSERRWWALLAPLGVAGVLCHGLFVMQLVPIGAVALLAGRPIRRGAMAAAAMLPAAAVVLYLHANGADSIGTSIQGGPGVLIASTFDSLLSRSVLPKLVLAQIVVIGVALAVRAVVRAPAPVDRAVAAIPAAWAVLPCMALALWFVDPVFNPRYLAPVGPGLGLLLATMALAADRRLVGPRRLIGPACVGLGVLMAVVLVTTPLPIDDDWRTTAQFVADEARPGDGIVFANASLAEPVQQRPPFEAAWREVDVTTTPVAVSPARPLAEVRRFDEPLPIDEIGPAATGAGLDRLWVVEQTHGAGGHLDRIVDAPETQAGWAEVDRWTFSPSIHVVLLERS